MESTPQPAARPRFSVIVPTLDRPAALARCLEALARLDYPRERFEVVVVDDGGAAPLQPVLSIFRPALDFRLLRQENAGPGRARNAAAGVARGEFLAFTDDDCLPAPDWLAALDARLTTDPESAVCGRVVNALAANPFSTASQLVNNYVQDRYNQDPKRPRFLTSNNLAVPAAAFRELGGFDPTFRATGEDRELCDRWLHHGRRLVYEADAVVFHAHELSALPLWRQHFRYGVGAVHVHGARVERREGLPAVEPLSFYREMLSYPFHRGRARRPALVASLIALTQVAYASGFYWQSLRKRVRRAASRPAAGTGERCT